MTYEEFEKIAKECGFTHTAPLDISTIDLKQEVRDMCSANTCGKYGKNWSCPPGCGTVDECKEKVQKYTKGILVQTVGDIEDSFDAEGLLAAAAAHDEHVKQLQDEVMKQVDDILILGAGTCKLCKECTYPDNPCRLPKLMHSSMEAYGMLVLEVCKKNNLTYYYGSDHIAYTGCILFN